MNTSPFKAGAAALALLIALGAGYGIGNWRSQTMAAHEPAAAPAGAAQGRKILYWYDPMVPTQKFDKPGKSPFMDMDLVPRYADEADAAAAPGVSVSAETAQSLGLRLASSSAAMHSSAVRIW
jgi:Cu(I)/Ag(I) efflux system membrane fusion protein